MVAWGQGPPPTSPVWIKLQINMGGKNTLQELNSTKMHRSCVLVIVF